MSKNNPRKTKASKRDAEVIIPVKYLGAAGHEGGISIGASIERHILIDFDGEVDAHGVRINAWEARRVAAMLIAAADRMDRISR